MDMDTDQSGHVSSVMTMSEFGQWFDAIWNNDSKRVHDMLSAASDEKRNVMLNGYFRYDDEILKPFTVSCMHRPYRPFCVAVVAGAKKVIPIHI